MALRQAILLTGGMAKRLGSITHVTNKHLLPVYDKPMLYHGLELLKTLGIEAVTIVLGGNSVGDIVNLVKDGEQFGMRITYVFQHEPKGISHAILLAEKTLEPGKFLVLLGDNVFDNINGLKPGIDAFFDDFSVNSALIVLYPSDQPQNYGQPIFNVKEELLGFIEKSKHPQHNQIVVGLYGLTKDAFEIIRSQKPSARGELEVTDTLNGYLWDTENMGMLYYKGFWTDCGTPEGLSEASEHFRRRQDNVKAN